MSGLLNDKAKLAPNWTNDSLKGAPILYQNSVNVKIGLLRGEEGLSEGSINSQVISI